MVIGRRLFALAVVAFVATAVFHATDRAQAAARAPRVIEIKGFKFGPKNPVVAVGDIVIWKNLDIVPHTVTAKDGSWGSGSIAAGGEWKSVVTQAMIGDYFCKFHPTMIAGLTVERS